MRSFYFWLSLSMGIGALVGSILRPGILEILIVLIIFNGLLYGIRSVKSKQAALKSI